MKVMVIIKSTASSERGDMPDEALLRDMGNYNEQLANAGIMLAGEGLHPSSKGVRVRFAGRNRDVVNGPFAETKELIAGFWIWRVKSMDEAVEWVKRCPNPMREESTVEIRQVFDAEDFGETFTPELREQESAVLAQNVGLNKPVFADGPAMLIAGQNQRYNAQTRQNIPQQWDQFLTRAGKLQGQVGDMSYGVVWNSSGDCEFDYLVGVEVQPGTEIPADYACVTVPAGRFAVFTHSGPIASIGDTIDKIWSKWAPDAATKTSTSAPCFERYKSDFNPETGHGLEIWVPLA